MKQSQYMNYNIFILSMKYNTLAAALHVLCEKIFKKKIFN